MMTGEIQTGTVPHGRMRRMVVLLLLLLFGMTVNVFAASAAPNPKGNALIDMSFSSAPLGYMLPTLGRLFDASFSISPGATGITVSVELTKVTFDEALALIGTAAGVEILQPVPEKRHYVVRAVGEGTSEQSKTEKETREKETRLAGSFMEVVTIRYVDVTDVRTAIEKVLGSEYATLCTVAQLNSDENRNYNGLVVYASTRKILDTVLDLVKTIDVPKPMVEIEALFVEITMTGNENIGVDWDIMKNPLEFVEDSPVPGLSKYFGLRFGQFWRVSPWEAEAMVSALKGHGNGRVLANPRIRVMSGRKAQFVSETQVPILTRNSDGEINTEWKNVGIGLEILPTVLEDESLYLKVIPRASAITGEKKLGDVTAPIISERKVESTMLVAPDETIVIGGLMNDSEVRSMSAVPILSQIPLFGELFKSRTVTNEKSTVVVFLRPRITYERMFADAKSTPESDERVRRFWDEYTSNHTSAEVNPSRHDGSDGTKAKEPVSSPFTQDTSESSPKPEQSPAKDLLKDLPSTQDTPESSPKPEQSPAKDLLKDLPSTQDTSESSPKPEQSPAKDLFKDLPSTQDTSESSLNPVQDSKWESLVKQYGLVPEESLSSPVPSPQESAPSAETQKKEPPVGQKLEENKSIPLD